MPQRVAFVLMPVGLAVALAIAVDVWQTRTRSPTTWAAGLPPLGMALRADGLSAAMMR